jgi:subtilisin family serine protease
MVFAAVGLASARDDERPASAGAGDRQILVMLESPPSHLRPDFDYGGAYGDGEGRSARLRIAAGLARRYGVALVSEWPMPLLGVDCFIMAVPAEQSPEEAALRLSRDPGVSWSEPLHLYRGQGEPIAHNDPLYRVQPAAKEWGLAELHQIATGRNVRVAVIDSMIEKNHPDLKGQVEVSENFVSGRPATAEQHGTGVAGIIAARADNGLGIAGLAPGARLLGLRACWQEPARADAPSGASTLCDSLSLARALTFAIVHKAQIINLSLSGPPDILLSKLLDVALGQGVVVVAAYDRGFRDGGFPASHRGVVAVAEETTDPPIAGVLNAPGRDIPTTQPDGGWLLVSGSSYAAAHVSGLFALMREHAPAPRSLSALVVAGPADRIDACATLLRTPSPCKCSCSRP